MEGHPDIRIIAVRHESEPPAEEATAFELQGLVSRQASPPTIRP